MWYHVINIFKGNYSNLAQYKTRESAEKRADKIQGGETYVFASLTSNPEEAIREFKDEELKQL